MIESPTSQRMWHFGSGAVAARRSLPPRLPAVFAMDWVEATRRAETRERELAVALQAVLSPAGYDDGCSEAAPLTPPWRAKKTRTSCESTINADRWPADAPAVVDAAASSSQLAADAHGPLFSTALSGLPRVFKITASRWNQTSLMSCNLNCPLISWSC